MRRQISIGRWFPIAISILVIAGVVHESVAGTLSVRVRATDQRAISPYVGVVAEDMPWSSPLQETILPQRLSSIDFEVSSGGYRIVAGAPNYLTVRRETVQVIDGQTARVEIDLVPLTPISGNVTDIQGAAVDGARVGLLPAFYVDWPQRLSKSAEDYLGKNIVVETDQRGRFTFFAHPTARHLLLIEADGYAPRLLKDVTATDHRDLDAIILRRGGALEVTLDPMPAEYRRATLLRDAGEPIPGLERADLYMIWLRPIEAPIRWTAIPPGHYRIAVDTMASSDVSSPPRVVGSVDVREGEVVQKSFALPRGGDAPPIAETSASRRAQIFVPAISRGAARGLRITTWTGESEKATRYSIEDVSGGVRFRLADGCASGARFLIATERQVGTSGPFSEPCSSAVRVELHPAARGRVLLRPAAGAPPPKGGIVETEFCSNRTLLAFPVHIDKGGYAEFPMPAGCITATLYPGRFAPLPLGRTVTNSGAIRDFAERQLVAGGVVLARIAAPDGTGIDGVRVGAINEDDLSTDPARLSSEHGDSSFFVTRNGGWVRLVGLPTGKSIIFVMRQTGRRTPGLSEPYKIEAGRQLIIDPLPLPPPARVEVDVNIPSDAVKAGLRLLFVSAASTGENPWPKRSPLFANMIGTHAEFDDLPPGMWTINILGSIGEGVATELAKETLILAGGESRIVALNVTSGVQRGRVLYSGRGVRGSLTFRTKRSAPITIHLDAEGRFVAPLRSDTYSVEFSQRPDEGKLGYVTLADVRVSGDDRPVDIELPDGRIRGRVMTADAPVGGVHVVAASMHYPRVPDGNLTDLRLETISDRDGTFAFDVVAEGSWAVEASDGGRSSERVNIDIHQHQAVDDITLELQKNETITGQVITATGEVAASSDVVIALPVNGRMPIMTAARTGPRGDFSIQVRPEQVDAFANIKVRMRDGSASCVRQTLRDPLLVQLPPMGDVELEWPHAEPAPAIMEILAAADGSTLSIPFCSTSRITRDGHHVLRIRGIGAGVWRYVVARTNAQAAAILHGSPDTVPALATFSVLPGTVAHVTVTEHTFADDVKRANN